MIPDGDDGKPTADGGEVEDRTFLNRWSQRKLEQDDKEPQSDAAVPPKAGAESEDDERRQLELQRNREEAEAIDVETLDAESDYAPFLKAGVPKALKSAALRTLWRSSPVFANVDGLNDYDENFNDPDRILKFVGSAWRVGKGYLKAEPEPAELETNAEGVVQDEPDARLNDGKSAEASKEASADGSADDEVQATAEKDQAPVEKTSDAGDGPPADMDADPDDGQTLDMPEKVPLRSRLALDDWDAGQGGS